MFRKSKRALTARLEPLGMALPDGTALMTFAPEVIDAVRYLVSRVTRQAPLPNRLALVSALRQEGTSYVAQALATVLANDLEKAICLVELNWWWPATWPVPLPAAHSLTAVLTDQTLLEEAPVDLMRPNLKLLPVGNLPGPSRSMMARGPKLSHVLDALAQQFDHVIMDIPALAATTDALPLLSLADGCCLVVRQGVTSIEDALMVLDDIAHLNILGVAMNKSVLKTPQLILKYIPQH